MSCACGTPTDLVNEYIHSNTVVIFSKSTCLYCAKVKEIFCKLNVNFAAYEIDKRPNGAEIMDVLSNITGGRTVPKVFVKGRFLGGCAEVEALFESGELQEILGITSGCGCC